MCVDCIQSEGGLLINGSSVLFRSADFGPQRSFAGQTVVATPQLADSDLTNATEILGAIAVVRMGVATPQEKVRRAQRAGAVAVIVVSTEDAIFKMEDSENSAGDITIPAVVVSSSVGLVLVTGTQVRFWPTENHSRVQAAMPSEWEQSFLGPLAKGTASPVQPAQLPGRPTGVVGSPPAPLIVPPPAPVEETKKTVVPRSPLPPPLKLNAYKDEEPVDPKRMHPLDSDTEEEAAEEEEEEEEEKKAEWSSMHSDDKDEAKAPVNAPSTEGLSTPTGPRQTVPSFLWHDTVIASDGSNTASGQVEAETRSEVAELSAQLSELSGILVGIDRSFDSVATDEPIPQNLRDFIKESARKARENMAVDAAEPPSITTPERKTRDTIDASPQMQPGGVAFARASFVSPHGAVLVFTPTKSPVALRRRSRSKSGESLLASSLRHFTSTFCADALGQATFNATVILAFETQILEAAPWQPGGTLPTNMFIDMLDDLEVAGELDTEDPAAVAASILLDHDADGNLPESLSEAAIIDMFYTSFEEHRGLDGRVRRR